MTHPGRLRWQSILALALVAAACGATRSADAQNYRALKPTPIAEARALTGRVSTILRGAGNPSAEDLKVLDDYFNRYFFSSMTVYEPPEVLGQLGTSREWLFTRYINIAKSQGARDHLTSITLKAMTAIAKGGYHPAVRYNAALIIGQLDQTPGAPLPAATEILVSLLENDEFSKVPAPTALKVAAIIGLQRRVDGLEPAMAERVSKAATAIALRKETPDDATPEVYGWVRKNAAKLLTALVAKGMTPAVHQTMVTLISDKTIDLDDRCNIAQLLKPDMYKTAEGLDLDAMTVALGDLAKQVLTLEAKDAKKYEEEFYSGGGGFDPGAGGGAGMPMGRGGERGMMGGGFGGAGMMLEETGPTYERRRMIDRLLAIADGASAVAAGGTDESKAKLSKLVDAVRGVAVASAAEDATLEEIAPAVQDLSVDVNKLVATWIPAAAADAADEPAAGDFGEEPVADEPADDPAAADAGEPEADVEEAPAKPAEPAAEEAAPPADETPAAVAPAAAAG
jgi:hypothetical protein